MFKFEKLAFGDLGWGDELLFATLMTITVSILSMGLGLCLAIIIIFYNNYVLKERLTPLNLVCIIVASAFLVNYFYYILTPKTKWMLDVITEPNDVKAWLDMYKKMNIYYHSGLAFGLVAVGAFGYAFR